MLHSDAPHALHREGKAEESIISQKDRIGTRLWRYGTSHRKQTTHAQSICAPTANFCPGPTSNYSLTPPGLHIHFY